jgi:iron complex outermembrane receptor protein
MKVSRPGQRRREALITRQRGVPGAAANGGMESHPKQAAARRWLERTPRRLARAARPWIGMAYTSSALAQAPPASSRIEASAREPLAEVVIVASTPLSGAELLEEQFAGSAQRVGGERIHSTRGSTLADVLQQNLAGVTLNESQGSPFMPDLNYRGFTSSPLLGLPQGLAIYQNGTRLNEPFGDTIAWDLIPELAIDEATLVTGLNPIYGLNALGGALSLRMKDGFSFQGARASVLGGSFGRLRGTLEAGLERDGWAAYAGGDVLRETGFRDHSPADARRLYADVRHRAAHHELAVSTTLARSTLTGNGPAPFDLLAERREAVFTYPDETKTSLALVTAEAGWSPTRALQLRATAFVRGSARHTLNGDAAELEACDDDPDVLCEEGDPEPVLGTGGGPVPASSGGGAAINTTRTRSLSTGVTLQLVSRHAIFAHDNQLTLGVSAARAVNRFQQRSEVGSFSADRGVRGSGFFRGDGGVVALRASSTYLGFYGTDTLTLLPHLVLTASARFNWFDLRMRERSIEALNADHDFSRLNPAAGLAYTPSPGTSLYANYSEASRAPTPAELSCADPEAPCRLPNAFLSDPPLDQVVTRSVELGARLSRELDADTAVAASFALFVARSRQDILFVAGSLVGTGYFRNAGTTQRAGLEASLSARRGSVETYLRYQLLRATFESSLLLPGANHPGATVTPEGGVIPVEPGDRIPGLPTHSAQLGADVQPIARLSVGGWLALSSSQYFRGDEANLLRPLSGYVTLNARGSYELSGRAAVFVRADNLLNSRFETFGLLGDAEEVIPGADDPRYASSGPPRSVWAGLDVQFSP